MTPQARKDRVDHAYRGLLAGSPTGKLVADIADRWGISRRSARSDVAKAYAILRADVIEAIPDRTDLLAQLISHAQDVIERSAAKGADNLTLGGINTLARLAGLRIEKPHPYVTRQQAPPVAIPPPPDRLR